MPEEIPVDQNATPPEATSPTPKQPAPKKKLGKWFRKIPKDILFSPGGVVLIFFAMIMEAIDWIPLPGLDSLTWEMALELIFIVFLFIIAKIPLQSMVIPFIIERFPVVSDILPTWFIRMFF